MANYNLRVNPTPHGKYNRSKGIILTLLSYCKDTLGNSRGLQLSEIADLVKSHDLDYEATKSCVFRSHTYKYLSRKTKSMSKGQPKCMYSISATGTRWLDRWVDNSMRQSFLQPMMDQLQGDTTEIRYLFGR